MGALCPCLKLNAAKDLLVYCYINSLCLCPHQYDINFDMQMASYATCVDGEEFDMFIYIIYQKMFIRINI